MAKKMIKVENLTKIYRKGKRKVVAINNISFTLDNKGFVFIVGKSGSGKSTLLNMLAGLDSVSEGEIIANGNQLSKFNKKDYDKYRNSYIGFIFQEFYLIEQLTLAQNVGISLSLANIDNQDAIYKAIEKVGEYNVENISRYYSYLLESNRDKDKKRIPLIKEYIKNHKKLI